MELTDKSNKELLLINSVKKHKVIFNKTCSKYRDSAARHAAWANVAKLCGTTIAECKKHWNKLRSGYATAKKRRTEISYTLQPWKYEEEMSFLDPYLKELLGSQPLPIKEVGFQEVEFDEDTWESPYSRSPGASNRIKATIQKERLLVDLIRRYEVIYNTKCTDYRNINERHAAWTEIADLHGSTVAQCKDTWKKLRNCYTNAINRQMVKSTKNLPFKPWRFDKEMSFLKPYLNVHMNGAEDSINEDEDSSEEFIYSKDVRSPEYDVTTRSTRKRKATDDFEADDKNTSELIHDNRNLDDIDYFFLSMSKMTKKLPKVDQLRIKLDLHTAINEAEMKLIQNDSCNDEDWGQIEVKREVSSPTRKESLLQELYLNKIK